LKTKTFILALICAASVASGQGKLQKILFPYKDSLKSYGISALVAKGNLVEQACIGFAYPNHPLQKDQAFGIGSITKTFVATIILKLQEEKLLNINDHIGKYIDPQNKFIDTSITIRQLLNHSSGIKDYSNPSFINTYLVNNKLVLSDRDILDQIDAVDFPKGTKHEYCNTNYFLLGLIIEKVTDRPVVDVIRDKIIIPYHLSNTYSYLDKEIKGLTHPMQNGNDLKEMISYHTISIQGKGVGQIASSTHDLYTFFKLLFVEKKILNQQSLDQMLSFEPGEDEEYGLGIFRTRADGKDLINHTGRTISYRSRAYYVPQDNVILVTLTNNMDDEYSGAIKNKILMEYLK